MGRGAFKLHELGFIAWKNGAERILTYSGTKRGLTAMSETTNVRADNAPAASSHYNDEYFAWQISAGKFSGWAKADRYKDVIRSSDRVLDFGCGGGFLLANLKCAERFGIEPNPAAREQAAKNSLTVFASPKAAVEALGEGTLDVIISDNALEHALEPWRELKAVLPLLRKGGTLHIVVPCEGIGWKYDQSDVNQHVYSWSPQSFGNLLKAAGFDVVYSRAYIHKFPPRAIRGPFVWLGRPALNFASRVWGRLDRRWFQVEALAMRPACE